MEEKIIFSIAIGRYLLVFGRVSDGHPLFGTVTSCLPRIARKRSQNANDLMGFDCGLVSILRQKCPCGGRQFTNILHCFDNIRKTIQEIFFLSLMEVPSLLYMTENVKI